MHDLISQTILEALNLDQQQMTSTARDPVSDLLSRYIDRLSDFVEFSREDQVKLLEEFRKYNLPTREILISASLQRLEEKLSLLKTNLLFVCDRNTVHKVQKGQKVFVVIEDPKAPGRTQQKMQSTFAKIAAKKGSNVHFVDVDMTHPDVSQLEVDSEAASSSFVKTDEGGSQSVSGKSHSMNLLVQMFLNNPDSEAFNTLGVDQLIDIANPANFIPSEYLCYEGEVIEAAGSSNEGKLEFKVDGEILKVHFHDILFAAVTGIASELDSYCNPPQDELYYGKRIRVWDSISGSGWVKGTIFEANAGYSARTISVHGDNGEQYYELLHGRTVDLRNPDKHDKIELLPKPFEDKYSHILLYGAVKIIGDDGFEYGFVSFINFERKSVEIRINTSWLEFEFDSDQVVYLDNNVVSPKDSQIAPSNLIRVANPDGDFTAYIIKSVLLDEGIVLAYKMHRAGEGKIFDSFSIDDLINREKYQLFENSQEVLINIHPELLNICEESHEVIFSVKNENPRHGIILESFAPAFLKVKLDELEEPVMVEMDQIIDLIPRFRID